VGLPAQVRQEHDLREPAGAGHEPLALKLTLQWLYENDPAYETIPLYDLPPDTPGATVIGAVPNQLDDLDTIFTTSLVVTF
jgi:hypothetical protein